MMTILAVVLHATTERSPESNLTDQHPGINANGMNGMKLERPLIDRSQIDQVRRDVDENAEPTN